MNKFLLALLCLLGQAGAFARAPAVALPVYGRLPFLEDMSLSPDGTRLALVRTNGDARTLFVVAVTGGNGQPLASAGTGKLKLRHVQWEDNDNLLLTISNTSPPPIGFIGADQEWSQLARLNIPSGKIRSVSFDVGNDARTFNVILGNPHVREVDGKIVTFARGLWVGSDSTMPGLFSISPNGNCRLVARGGRGNEEWLVDANGKIASELSYDSNDRTWLLRARQEGGSLNTIARQG